MAFNDATFFVQTILCRNFELDGIYLELLPYKCLEISQKVLEISQKKISISFQMEARVFFRLTTKQNSQNPHRFSH